MTFIISSHLHRCSAHLWHVVHCRMAGSPCFGTLVHAVVIHELIGSPVDLSVSCSMAASVALHLHRDLFGLLHSRGLRRISAVLLNQTCSIVSASEDLLQNLLDWLGLV